MELLSTPDSFEELIAQNNYLRQLLDAAVYGNIPNGADLTTMLYAMRARAYIKYITDTMGDEDDDSVF